MYIGLKFAVCDPEGQQAMADMGLGDLTQVIVDSLGEAATASATTTVATMAGVVAAFAAMLF